MSRSGSIDPAEPASDVRTVNEVLYHRIKVDILAGAIEGRLRFEELRVRYGGSVGSLREALSKLESEGLIESERHRWLRVPRLTCSDFEDLVSIRVLIECRCLRNSIAHGDEAWEQRLRDAFEGLRANAHDECQVESAVRRMYHDNLHDALVSGCTSQRLLWLRNLLRSQAERYLSVAFSLSLSADENADAIARHKALVDAALERRTNVAVALIEDDIESAARRVMPRLAQIEAEQSHHAPTARTRPSGDRGFAESLDVS